MDRAALISAILAGSKEGIQNALPVRYAVTKEDVEQMFFRMIDEDVIAVHYWDQGTTRKPKKEELPTVLFLLNEYLLKMKKQPHAFDAASEYDRKITMAVLEEILLESRATLGADRRIIFKTQKAN